MIKMVWNWQDFYTAIDDDTTGLFCIPLFIIMITISSNDDNNATDDGMMMMMITMMMMTTKTMMILMRTMMWTMTTMFIVYWRDAVCRHHYKFGIKCPIDYTCCPQGQWLYLRRSSGANVVWPDMKGKSIKINSFIPSDAMVNQWP